LPLILASSGFSILSNLSDPTWASHNLNGSALAEGTDWKSAINLSYQKIEPPNISFVYLVHQSEIAMNIEDLRDYCLSKPGTTEGLPFGEQTLVFKVGGKIFLLIRSEQANCFNAKCDPERAMKLREKRRPA
jgi:hypothetical protein